MGLMGEWKDLLRKLGVDESVLNEKLVISEQIEKGGKKDKSKLVPVQRQVTRNGKTFTQTVYVSPEEAKANKQGNKQKQPTAKASGGKVDIQAHLRPIRKALGTEKYKEYLKANGIKWEKADNPGADTMRASMAAKKWLEAGNKLDENLYQSMLKGKNRKYKEGEEVTVYDLGKHKKGKIIGYGRENMYRIKLEDGETDLFPESLINVKPNPVPKETPKREKPKFDVIDEVTFKEVGKEQEGKIVGIDKDKFQVKKKNGEVVLLSESDMTKKPPETEYTESIKDIVRTELKQEKVAETLKEIKRRLGNGARGVGLWAIGDGGNISGAKKENVERVIEEFKKLPDFEVSDNWEYYKTSPTKWEHAVRIKYTGSIKVK